MDNLTRVATFVFLVAITGCDSNVSDTAQLAAETSPESESLSLIRAVSPGSIQADIYLNGDQVKKGHIVSSTTLNWVPVTVDPEVFLNYQSLEVRFYYKNDDFSIDLATAKTTAPASANDNIFIMDGLSYEYYDEYAYDPGNPTRPTGPGNPNSVFDVHDIARIVGNTQGRELVDISGEKIPVSLIDSEPSLAFFESPNSAYLALVQPSISGALIDVQGRTFTVHQLTRSNSVTCDSAYIDSSVKSIILNFPGRQVLLVFEMLNNQYILVPAETGEITNFRELNIDQISTSPMGILGSPSPLDKSLVAVMVPYNAVGWLRAWNEELNQIDSEDASCLFNLTSPTVID